LKKFGDEKSIIIVEFHIESKDFIALKELVHKFELMDSDVIMKAMMQFEFGNKDA